LIRRLSSRLDLAQLWLATMAAHEQMFGAEEQIPELIGQLALEAEFRGMKVSDLIGELIMQAFGKRDPAR
jgi:hypothetical protein